MKYYKI